jgi:hypothetical protein
MAVTPMIALASLAVVFLLFLCRQVWWQSGDTEGVETLSPVDLEAFRNLTDPAEARFLRVNLSPKDFRRIQRVRLRAAAMYVAVISKNAGRLVVIGRYASSHPDAETASAGLDIVRRALDLKLWCALALLKINATAICPTLLSPSNGIVDRYLDVTSMTDALPKTQAA